MRNKPLFLFGFFAFSFYIASILLALIDSGFSYRWVSFALWILAVLILPLYFAFQRRKKLFESLQKFFARKQDNYAPLFLVIAALVCSFLYLKEYPFVAIYDQIRDGGINAQQIADGTFKNIFGYGRYASHGAIIPTITSFFYLIFKNSVFTFRVPATLLSIFDVLILYAAVRKGVNKHVAFFASLILLVLPLHLYFARTEVVVMFSGFFTSLIFLLLAFFVKKKEPNMYILLGLLLGFASGFHTSIRTVSLLTIIVISALTCIAIWRKKLAKVFYAAPLLMVLFYFVGFGPRILYSPPQTFFQTRSLANAHVTANKIATLADNYKKSLLVYISQPTTSTHFQEFKPLLPPVLAIFFILGLLSSIFFGKNIFLRILIFYAFALPFTNSAITEAVNSDNRLLPLLPIAAIFAAYGFYKVLLLVKRYISNTFLLNALQIIFAGYLIFLACTFFLNEPASKQYTTIDYLSMHAIYFLQKNPEFKSAQTVCVSVAPTNYEYFSLLHVQEQYQYFLPKKNFLIFQNPDLAINAMAISKSCSASYQTFSKLVYCNPYQKFLCPKNETLTLYYQNKFSQTQTAQMPQPSIHIAPTPLTIP
ncbi:MAG TPA: glycosyltransferase family 39 protein [Candidatus Saccharimonadales bacterium]|nr:glycosyltransferase family 39 protein [Candidatus Saccharimonadales bacterium]